MYTHAPIIIYHHSHHTQHTPHYYHHYHSRIAGESYNDTGEEVEAVGGDEDAVEWGEVLDDVGAVQVEPLPQPELRRCRPPQPHLLVLVAVVDEETDVVRDGHHQQHDDWKEKMP